MKKYIPIEKRSKKEQRLLSARKRGSWYGINPVTRKPQNSKAYQRQKARKWSDDLHDRAFYYHAELLSLVILKYINYGSYIIT